MKMEASKEIFGRLEEISKPDYELKVTKASKKHFVVVLLYQTYVTASNLLGLHLEKLARKYKATSFLKITADLCIENYPDKNVPTLLIYGNGELKKQLIGEAAFGGKVGMSFLNVEMMLKGLGSLGKQAGDYREGAEDEELKKFHLNYQGKKDNDSDSDWDE